VWFFSVTIVGIDCATTNRKTGLAFASLPANGLLMVEECFVAQATPSLAAQIHARLTIATPVLIALDAVLCCVAAIDFLKGLASYLLCRDNFGTVLPADWGPPTAPNYWFSDP
jgi:hypothetical protein